MMIELTEEEKKCFRESCSSQAIQMVGDRTGADFLSCAKAVRLYEYSLLSVSALLLYTEVARDKITEALEIVNNAQKDLWDVLSALNLKLKE